MRNEHDANLSLQPLERATREPVRLYREAPKNRPWVDLLRAAVVLALFASIGVMLGLGA